MLYLDRHPPAPDSSFALPPGRSVLGRSPEAQLHIADPSISRLHAELRVASGQVYIRDLGSHNGTSLNDERLGAEAWVKPGDTIRCGDVALVLRERDEEQPETVGPTRHPFGAQVKPTHTLALSHASLPGADPTARRLATLLRLGELLAHPASAKDLLGRILDLAHDILPIDRAVLLSESDKGGLEVIASRQDGASIPQPYSESIVRYVIEQRVAVCFDDAQSDERLHGAASLIAQSIRSAMCAPLVVDERLLGVIYVDNRVSAHTFGSQDLELLAGFANQAALAIHNSALQARLQDTAVRLNTFARYFPPATAARLSESGGDLGVQELFVTALFSDISAYTAMSATMAPAEVVALLQAYFPPMARIVFEREGTLEKYIGDALMAVWGAPYSHADDADRALDAAVEMHEAVLRMRETLPRPIDIHIGMHSGVVALANIGSREYLQVATIGDATNTSARVCAAAGDGELVITRATADRLTRRRFALTALPPTVVKGKAEPLELFRVEWRRSSLSM